MILDHVSIFMDIIVLYCKLTCYKAYFKHTTHSPYHVKRQTRKFIEHDKFIKECKVKCSKELEALAKIEIENV